MSTKSYLFREEDLTEFDRGSGWVWIRRKEIPWIWEDRNDRVPIFIRRAPRTPSGERVYLLSFRPGPRLSQTETSARALPGYASDFRSWLDRLIRGDRRDCAVVLFGIDEQGNPCSISDELLGLVVPDIISHGIIWESGEVIL